MRRETRTETAVLNKEQIMLCIQELASNEVHSLAMRLMLLTGLRNEEARTFPSQTHVIRTSVPTSVVASQFEFS